MHAFMLFYLVRCWADPSLRGALVNDCNTGLVPPPASERRESAPLIGLPVMAKCSLWLANGAITFLAG